MTKRIVEIFALIALVAILGSATRARFGAANTPDEAAAPLVPPNPERFSIAGICLGMSEVDAQAQLGRVGKDEDSGYRWSLEESEICSTFYIHDGKVMAVTGKRVEYEATPYLEEAQPVSYATDRLGHVPVSYDIPGYGALCYSRIGLIVGTDSMGENLMERFTLLPIGSELEEVPYSWWNGRNPELWVAAPLKSKVGFCVGYPGWREFEDKRAESSNGPAELRP